MPSLPSGLSAADVRERLARGKSNAYDSIRGKSTARVVVENLFTVFNLVNVGVISFLLYYYVVADDRRLLWDSIGVIGVVVFNTAIAIAQEWRAARSLAKMDALANRPVVVVREGERRTIDKREVVEGDVIELTPGDQAVADGATILSRRLEIDESSVTGESAPVAAPVGYEIRAGVFCLAGSGFYRAERVGAESSAAKLAAETKKYRFRQSPLLRKINLVFVVSFAVTLALVGVETAVALARGVEFSRDAASVEAARNLSTIAITLIPEGLVFFSSVTFLLGVFKIAGEGALVRKLNAMDAFATIDAVCLDKTGTLTRDKLAVSSVRRFDGAPDDLDALIAAYRDHTSDKNATVRALGYFEGNLDAEWRDEIPFRSERKAGALTLAFGDVERTFVLGAHDALVGKLVRDVPTPPEGSRNLLFGEVFDAEFAEEHFDAWRIVPYAAVATRDEPRPDAKEAIELFERNGVEVKIISGDALDSILATTREIGLDVPPDKTATGEELARMTDEEFNKAARERTVFARVSPDRKKRLVAALRASGRETAFIGDGVNDLPALKESDLAIAPESGSAMAREAADATLRDDKFSALPKIFEEGNVVLNTVNFVARLFVAKNVLAASLAIAGWTGALAFPLTPRSASLLNLLAVGLPAYFVALRNKNARATGRFFRDVFAFAATAAPIGFAAAYASQRLGASWYGLSGEELAGYSVAAVVAVSTIAFWGAVSFEDRKNRAAYGLYAAGLLAIYAFLLSVEPSFFPMNLVFTFYEIVVVPSEAAGALAGIVLAGGAAVIALNWMRARIWGAIT
ncbi:MAG: HAD-IC family P-type ATPase [Ignavibacteriales bacterium]|nr:HAD-IC family P-type ATPase [Ignavibacteriales bacterium]